MTLALPLRRGEETRLPTVWGTWRAVGFAEADADAHLALVLGDPGGEEPALVRPHSECLTGDTLGSLRCDCQAQLHLAMRTIGEAGRGVLVYLRQEGRGVGLMDKLRAYRLQDEGLDTVDANLRLGLPVDARDFRVAGRILGALGVRRVRLLSNNPRKEAGIAAEGVEVVETLPLLTAATPHNAHYLATKRDRLGHRLADA